MSNSLWPHGLSTPGLPVLHYLLELLKIMSIASQWCYPMISSSVATFSSCPQSFPASGSFPVNQLFALSGQSTGASALASVLPVNIQDWFPLGLTGLISLQSKELSSLLQHQSSKASVLQHSAFFRVQLSHPYMTTRKTIALTIWTFVNKVICLLFNMLSRLLGTRIEGSGELLFNAYWVSVWVIKEFWK